VKAIRPIKRRAPGLVAAAVIALAVGAPGFVLAYSLIGGSLGLTTTVNGYQRDFRVWNNSADPQSNNNTTVNASYPGALGAVMASWKAARQWASDTTTASRNFDFDYQGTTTANNADANTIGWASTGCSGGTLAYTETPISNGWRIVMCDSWVWEDGPTAPGGNFDIEGVLTHELGHALGLGHSAVSCGGSCSAAPTMCPSICGTGFEARSIQADDQSGLQAIYGVKPANKPVITSLSGSTANGGTLIINGSNFATSVNVKFTAGTTQNTGSIPGVVTGVASTGGGTQISVVVPAAAVDGNVLVWQPGSGLLSNAFPIDVNFVPPSPPSIASLSPSSVPAFQGGTVTVTGNHFNGATAMTVNGVSTAFVVVNDATITFTAPTAAALGPTAVTVTSPNGTSAPASFDYVEVAPTVLVATALAVTGAQMTWSWGAGANDLIVLLASLDPTTDTFGTPFNILLNFVIVATPVANAAGTGSFSMTFPPGLAGSTFYSQIVALDEITAALNSVSNIPSTFVFF
jgi:hypothetical protein